MDERIAEYSASLGIDRRHISDEEILKRCLYPMINRAAHLLADGVALKPSDIDIVYVTGYGFPAHRGGPLYWADQIGSANILADIERFRGELGIWWEPAPLLVELAQNNRRFADLQQSAELT
jgi:3-hydroxyacyl-CoA dehydrogenase